MDDYTIPASFEAFPKMARLNRDCIITEKIDGTNAQICITGDGGMQVGSRTRWLDAQNDNMGFYAWAMRNRDELMKLGPGRHFGEWWGSKIQRGYGLAAGDKRFSLFNTSRWNAENIPACCSVVPELYKRTFSTEAVMVALDILHREGSHAAPGYMKPEGIVVFHVAANQAFKVTIEHDEVPKGLVRA